MGDLPKRCPIVALSDPPKPCMFDKGHKGPHSYLVPPATDPLDVEAIRLRASDARLTPTDRGALARTAADVPALLDALAAARAEVERLTREADEAIAQAERWSEDAAVLERERDAIREDIAAEVLAALAMDLEQQAQKCRAVTPNDYTEGSHDAYLNAARIARAALSTAKEASHDE